MSHFRAVFFFFSDWTLSFDLNQRVVTLLVSSSVERAAAFPQIPPVTAE